MSTRAQWTIMIYLAGDNNLSTAGDADLAEMRRIGSTADVNVIAEFDNASDQGTRRYRIQRDGTVDLVMSLGETDSGSPEVLLDFISWATSTYPADRYALVLWNHGCGWEPLEVDKIAREVGAAAYNAREAAERSASPLGRVFFRSSLQRIFRIPSPADRAICSDDGSGHSLDTIELSSVMKRATHALGRPFDLLGMDACLMSNLEVAYQIEPYVRYMVASEEIEPGAGWPYDAVLTELVAHPDLPTAQLAMHIVRAYGKSYADQGYTGVITQSALDLSQIATVVDPLDRLADALLAAMPHVSATIWAAQRTSARFWHNTLWDVAHFCEELERLSDSEAIRGAAQDVRAALVAGADRFVLAEMHSGEKVAHSGGISIYLIPPLTDISRYYADLDYAKRHRWLTLLQTYHAN
jgi:hypothetical protein